MITMLNCDCMDFMAGCKDKQFGLAIVDPPYDLGRWSSTGGNSLSEDEVRKINSWDNAPNIEFFLELKRVSKNQIIWGGNNFFSILGNCKSLVIWDKAQRGMHFADGELAWTSFNSGALRIFNYSIKNHSAKEIRFHPTQKPVALYKWLLSRYAKPGDTILDTHGGSGSICIACHDLGFDLT